MVETIKRITRKEMDYFTLTFLVGSDGEGRFTESVQEHKTGIGHYNRQCRSLRDNKCHKVGLIGPNKELLHKHIYESIIVIT